MKSTLRYCLSLCLAALASLIAAKTTWVEQAEAADTNPYDSLFGSPVRDINQLRFGDVS